MRPRNLYDRATCQRSNLMVSPDPGAAPAADEDGPGKDGPEASEADRPTASERVRLMLAILASELGVSNGPDADAATEPNSRSATTDDASAVPPSSPGSSSAET